MEALLPPGAAARAARMLAVFTPAGLERLIEETHAPAPDGTQEPPGNLDAVAARYPAAAARHGLVMQPEAEPR